MRCEGNGVRMTLRMRRVVGTPSSTHSMKDHTLRQQLCRRHQRAESAVMRLCMCSKMLAASS
jgi:hypothetical protein